MYQRTPAGERIGKMEQEYLKKASSLLHSTLELSRAKYELELLPGDASTRRYFRVQSKGEDRMSYILLATQPFQLSTNNFLLVQKLFSINGVPVPEVLGVDEKEGLILLSDLGDTTMLRNLGVSMEEERKLALFQNAITLMMNIHAIDRSSSKNIPVFSLEFDKESLMREVEFTFRYFFQDYLRRDIPDRELSSMREAFGDICSILAKGDKVLTHRDFHTRNLMINSEEKLFCIDFQDARMGVPQYDLCSLLRDSYYQLSEQEVQSLLNFYMKEYKSRYKHTLDERKFLYIFNLMSTQRNFKAIGSFASFYVNRNDPSYLRFIGNTFENVRRNLEKFSEYKELNKLLLKWYCF